VRELIRRLSDRTELVLVTAIAFSLVTVSSAWVLLSGVRQVDLSTARVLRGIVLELLILLAAGAILSARGWTLDRLGLRFSWKAALAGVPFFILYLLLYWITATVVLLLWPAAREVWVFRYTVSAPFWLLLVMLVVHSFFEEVLVTGYVISALSREGAALAITASTLLRFAYHLYQGPLASISVIPLGLAFGAMFWRGRSLWPLIVAHTIANVVAFVLNPERLG
jgi:membrane protease YdiL (CAAX protease family)